jgi:predicted ATPase
MGDSILAFFGAPIAHEDDPQRAVLSGLDIVEHISSYRDFVNRRHGIDFNVRVGINTGMVVVGTVGSDLRMEYTAMGDAINLAARMEQTAGPGTVQIAHDTYKLVAPLFEFEELGGIQVKGKDEPVPAYRVLGRKAKAGRLRGIAGLEVPLIGRNSEMTELHEAIARLQKGVGGIVGLIGDAGLGKSRLIRELKESESLTPKISWLQTSSLSYETAQPYNLFRRLIRRMAEATPIDPPKVLDQKINTALEGLALDEHLQTRRAFESLFGLPGPQGEPPLEGEIFKQLFLSATSNLWEARANLAPSVLVFDDLHWADAASVELLAHLFELTERVPLLIVCSFRPERQAPGWQLKNIADRDYLHRYSELSLKPLSEEDSQLLLSGLTPGANIPDAVGQSILEKAAGIPYYIEEVVRGLMESKALARQNGSFQWAAADEFAAIELPDNLNSLLVARIDRLEEEARRILQLASVVGRAFYYRVLAQIEEFTAEIDPQLRQLVRVNMIQEAAREPELEYIFSNVLIQEAAYQTILLRQRRQFHGQVGEALESLFPDRLEELAPVLAVHFAEAGDDEKTLKYHILAGDAAYRMYALDDAVNHYRQALQIANKDEAIPVTSQQLLHLYTRLGRAHEHMYLFDQVQEIYEEMRERADQDRDQRLKLAYYLSLGTVYVTYTPLKDPEAGQTLAEKALSLADELGDRRAKAKAQWNLLLLHRFFTGDMEAARQNGEASLEIARDLKWEEQLAYTLNDLSFVYLGLRDLNRCLICLDEAQDLWRKLGNLPMLTDNLNVSALMHYLSGEYDKAIETGNEGLQLADSIGSRWNKPPLYQNLSRVYRERGELGLAFQYVHDAEKLLETQTDPAGRLFLITILLTVYGDLGLVDPSMELYSQSLDLVDDIDPAFSRMAEMLPALKSRLHLINGDPDAGRKELGNIWPNVAGITVLPFIDLFLFPFACEVAIGSGEYERVLSLAEEFSGALDKSGIRSMLPDSYYFMGRALWALERPETAYEAIVKARAAAEEIGACRILYQILDVLAEMEASRGNVVEAAALREQAQEVVSYIADHAGGEELRASFMALPEVQAVLKS